MREIFALGQLAQMSKSKEFAEAAGKAIARPVTSTANMIVHPVETISGIPDGVGRMYDRVKLGTQKVYESATAMDTSDSDEVADVSFAQRGEIDHVSLHFIGVLSEDAIYRFIHGFTGQTMVGHHFFAADADKQRLEDDWRSWLERTFAGAAGGSG